MLVCCVVCSVAGESLSLRARARPPPRLLGYPSVSSTLPNGESGSVFVSKFVCYYYAIIYHVHLCLCDVGYDLTSSVDTTTSTTMMMMTLQAVDEFDNTHTQHTKHDPIESSQ